MTNITSGHKRSWEGSEIEGNRNGTKGLDWRDVHLKSPSRKPTSRPYTHDRPSPGHYGGSGRRAAEAGGSRGNRTDYGRSTDGHEKGNRPRDDYRPSSRPPQKRVRSKSPDPIEDEREEGEISPRRTNSPTPVPASSKLLSEKVPPAESNTNPPHSAVEADIDLDLQPSPPPVEDIVAARRAKRQAILAKYAGAASVTASVSSGPGPSSAAPSPIHTSSSSISNLAPQTQTNGVNGYGSPLASKPIIDDVTSRHESESVSPTPGEFALAKEGESSGNQRMDQMGVEQISAADYDPSLDRREDEQKRFVMDRTVAEEGEVLVEEEEEDDVDDMFSISTTKKKKVKKVKDLAVPALITTSTLDTAADPEGYYNIILGEQLDGGRYQVFSSIGKGMFANVVRARILKSETGDTGREVAIKIVRCQESMYRAGQKEVQMLNKLSQADPDDKKHIVRLERTFEHRGHLCLVFEAMSMNLREVVKRFGKDVGLNIRAVRAYAHQLFLALSLLRKLNIMHADIKPDNILANEQKTVLKLCDLGSASDASENEITPYLVSRFYRAPEIILGIPYDPALDIWSVGCTLYELYTGKILFPGRSNNQMLLLMMELKGRFNNKMVKKAKFGDIYFDEMGGFESVEKDRITGNDVIRKVHLSKPTRDLRARLMPPASSKISEEENKMMSSFIDLLDKCLALDPARRIGPRDALVHPFIRGCA